MASAYGQTGRSVSVGRILSRTFGAIGGNPGVMLAIALLFGGLPQTGIAYLQEVWSRPDQLVAVGFGTAIALMLLAAFGSMVFGLIVQGGLVRATMAEMEGDRATLGECLATGLRRALPLLGIAILSGLGIMLGFLLLIVPGVIFLLMWSVAVPVTVIERRGVIESMSRSGDLTAGARGSIFAVMVLVWVVNMAAGLVSGAATLAIYGDGLASTIQEGFPVAFIAINAVTMTAATVFAAAVPTAIYVELREWKEGPLADTLADIFA